MAIKAFRHPETGQLRKVNDEDKLRLAALDKLGYVEFTEKDLDERGLTVTYEQVARTDVPKEPPALPKLTTPIPPAATRDTALVGAPRTEELKTPEKVGDPVLVVTEQPAGTVPAQEKSRVPPGRGITREDVQPLSKSKN